MLFLLQQKVMETYPRKSLNKSSCTLLPSSSTHYTDSDSLWAKKNQEAFKSVHSLQWVDNEFWLHLQTSHNWRLDDWLLAIYIFLKPHVYSNPPKEQDSVFMMIKNAQTHVFSCVSTECLQKSSHWTLLMSLPAQWLSGRVFVLRLVCCIFSSWSGHTQ